MAKKISLSQQINETDWTGSKDVRTTGYPKKGDASLPDSASKVISLTAKLPKTHPKPEALTPDVPTSELEIDSLETLGHQSRKETKSFFADPTTKTDYEHTLTLANKAADEKMRLVDKERKVSNLSGSGEAHKGALKDLETARGYYKWTLGDAAGARLGQIRKNSRIKK